jgi:hypothetical protein
MSAGAVVYARLSADTDAGERVYPQVLPQGGTYPAITYTVISRVPLHAMGSDAPLVRYRVQVDAYGSTYAEAHTVAKQVEARLSRFRGTLGEDDVLDCLLDTAADGYEQETALRRVSMDFTLFLGD